MGWGVFSGEGRSPNACSGSSAGSGLPGTVPREWIYGPSFCPVPSVVKGRWKHSRTGVPSKPDYVQALPFQSDLPSGPSSTLQPCRWATAQCDGKSHTILTLPPFPDAERVVVLCYWVTKDPNLSA